MEWTNELTLEFLSLYEHEPVIWNPKHPKHKNRNAAADAWKRIEDSFSVECAVKELKKKKESLMAIFRPLLNKVKASMTAGTDIDAVYKPNWFAYETMANFLWEIYQPRTIPNTEDMAARIKTKSAQLLHYASETGGGETSISRLTSTEKDMVPFIKLEVVEGHSEMVESICARIPEPIVECSQDSEQPLDSYSADEGKATRMVPPLEEVLSDSESAFGTVSKPTRNVLKKRRFLQSKNCLKTYQKKFAIKEKYYERKMALMERDVIAKEQIAKALSVLAADISKDWQQ